MQRNGNVTMKFFSLSWQASICLAHLLPLFFLSFFLLFSLFWRKYLFLDNGMKIFWVGQGISSLAQWHDNPIYSRCYRGVWYEVSLSKQIEIKHNLEASLSVFWSQNWILLDVSNDSCFCKFVHMYVCFSLGVYKQ